MAAIRQLPNGRWQLDYQDRELGIPRIKRTRDTKKECEELLEIYKAQYKNLLRGGRVRRLFGEALAEYLQGPSAEKKTHDKDLSNAQALRWPVADGRRWIRLEELPLEKAHAGELDIVDGLDLWLKDMRGILRRAYIGGTRDQMAMYQQRLNSRQVPTWYYQPDPTQGAQPQPRYEVKDRALIAQLEASKGRGPMAPDTIRVRQALASRVLAWAFKKRWTAEDQSRRIERQAPGARRRDAMSSYEQMRDLLTHLPEHYGLAALAAASLGWRKSNLYDLEWSHVVFPIIREEDGQEQIVRPGIAWVDESKNSDPVVHPMSPLTEQIFRLAWDWRDGNIVFHNGHGKRIGDIRKAFRTAWKAAGLGKLTWHGLRRTWATWMVLSGAGKHELKALGGWRQDAMPGYYTQLQVEHLVGTVNRFQPARQEDITPWTPSPKSQSSSSAASPSGSSDESTAGNAGATSPASPHSPRGSTSE